MALVLLGLAGLVLKGRYQGPFGDLVYSYGGNVAASFSVYFLAMLVATRSKRPRAVAAALSLSVVELFELLDGFGVMSNVYDRLDLAANAAGIALAVGLDAVMAPRGGAAPRPSSVPNPDTRVFRREAPWHSAGRAALLLFVLSFSLRAALLPFAPLDPAWTLRMENGRVAHQLVLTGEFANPYVLPTGPTGHTIPLYTSVMALIYWMFGTTMAAEYARCWLTIASFSAMYALMPWFAARLGLGVVAGFVGGLIGALSPVNVLAGITGGLGEELVGIALGFLMVASLARWTTDRVSARASFLLGVGWGAAFHNSPQLLLVLAGFLAFESWWRRNLRRWRPLAVLVAGVVVACVPWAARNYVTFHDFVFIRSNFGLELRMGNHDGAAADVDVMDHRRSHAPHPGVDPGEAVKVATWGELPYMRNARREALQWIHDHPGGFVRLTASRFLHVWFGSLHLAWVWLPTGLLTILAILGVRRTFPGLTVPERAALLIPLATFPLVNYVVMYMPRYRIPLDWIVLVFVGAEVSAWMGHGRDRLIHHTATTG